MEKWSQRCEGIAALSASGQGNKTTRPSYLPLVPAPPAACGRMLPLDGTLFSPAAEKNAAARPVHPWAIWNPSPLRAGTPAKPQPCPQHLACQGSTCGCKGVPSFPGTRIQLETPPCHGAGSDTLKRLEGNPSGMLPPHCAACRVSWQSALGESSLSVMGKSWKSLRGVCSH